MIHKQALVVVVIAGCAAETPEDRVQDLLARSTVCGSIDEPSYLTMSCRGPDVSPEQIVDCMTDALGKGTRAMVAWWKEDGQLHGYVTYAFAINGTLDVIDYYPGPWRGGDGPHVAWERTCAGPLRADTTVCPYNGATMPTVTLDGCSQ